MPIPKTGAGCDWLISLVIPAYNEEKGIERTVLCALEFFRARGLDAEIIFVDDGSRDDTCKILKKYEGDRLRIFSYPQNRGKGYALRLGVENSRGKFVFFTDADMAYGFSYIEPALEILKSGRARMVAGSRRILGGGYEKYGALRRLMSWAFCALANMVLNLGLSDVQCGFKGFEGEFAREVFGRCGTDRFGIDFEVLYLARKTGAKIAEIPVRIVNHGQTSVHPLRDSARMAAELFAVRRRHGKRKKGGNRCKKSSGGI